MNYFLRINILFVIFLSSLSFDSKAQCNTNTTICDLSQNPTFNFVNPGNTVSTCLDFYGPSVGYIVLYITQGGQLNMLIDGSSSSGFIDVAVFNIPSGQSPCTAINNNSNQLGCNYASSPSGCNQFGTQFGCASSVPAPTVTAGQTIMIVAENWSGSSSSFSLELSGSPGSAQTGPPSATINPAGPFCVSAASQQLTANNQGGTWSGPGVSPSGMFNPSAAGVGTHTISYSIGVAPCNSNVATSTVTVNPNGVVNVTPQTSTICPGGSTTLTASGFTSYFWSPSTGLSAATGATVSASPSSTTTYTVTGTMAGCTGTGTATVEIGIAPAVVASTNAPICEGETLNLFASSTPNATYSWTGPNGFTSTDQNPVIPNFDNSNVGLYSVEINLNGCVNNSSVQADMNPDIIPVITPANPICMNENPFIFQVDVPGGIWSGNGINPQTGYFNPAISTPGNQVIEYSLPGFCGGSSQTTILVKPVPVIDISSDIQSGCGPLTVQFQNLTTPASQQVLWDFGNGNTSTQLGNQTQTFVAETCFTISLTATTDGCVNSQSFPSFICVIPDPVADFSVSSYTATMFDPSFEFTNLSTGASDFIWDFQDGTTSTAINPLHTYPEQAGAYDVMLIAINYAGCRDTANHFVYVEDELIFYVPNSFTPDGDEYNNTFKPILTSGIDPFSFGMTIYNRWGELIFETHDADYGWDGSFGGKIAAQGGYSWKITFKDAKTDKRYQYTGHLTLIR